MSGWNFNLQNTLRIPAVKIFVFLELEHKSAFFKGFVFTAFHWVKYGITPSRAMDITLDF